MTVYAQNEFPPYGAAVRSAPDIAAEQIAGVEANRPIEVSGWTEVDEVAYQENPDLWAGRHWYQLADESGWVNIAGIRSTETDTVRLKAANTCLWQTAQLLPSNSCRRHCQSSIKTVDYRNGRLEHLSRMCLGFSVLSREA